MTPIPWTEAELTTVLASLRFLQSQGRADLSDLLEGHKPILNDDEIDRFCQRLNTADMIQVVDSQVNDTGTSAPKPRLAIERLDMPVVRINAPHWFRREDFRRWLGAASRGDQTPRIGRAATWYRESDGDPDEYADVFMTFDAPDGSNSDLPKAYWDELLREMDRQLPGVRDALIWLTNLDSGQPSGGPASNTLTRQQKSRYLSRRGTHCPFCDSDQIEGTGDRDYDGDWNSQVVECRACGKRWQDIYTLTGVEPED